MFSSNLYITFYFTPNYLWLSHKFPYSFLLFHSRLVVWFVSHCNAYSGRDQIAKNLYESLNSMKRKNLLNSTNLITSKYGRCGNRIIEKWSNDENQELSHNKFYLSFENSKCPGYITEKLFKIINADMSENPPVPIVMGAKKSWYTMNLPPKSFIHVDDFASTYELARYLIFLNSNHTEYLKFLEWRKHYKKAQVDSIGCQICKNLFEHSLSQQNDTLVIRNFLDFWNKAKCENKYTRDRTLKNS